MAVLSGTCTGVEDFLSQLNTFVLANGWNLLRGNPAVDPAGTWFTWQAPGFDVVRRPYVHMKGIVRGDLNASFIEIRVTPGNDNAVIVENQNDGPFRSAFTGMLISGVPFRIYVDALRVVGFFNSQNDYTSFYAGFFTPFSLPTQFPFPIFQAGNFDQPKLLSDSFDSNRHIFDPSTFTAIYRRWDGLWRRCYNKNEGSSVNITNTENTDAVLFPYHVGRTGSTVSVNDSRNFPSSFNYISTSAGNPLTALTRFIPTAQGNLPMFPILILDKLYGPVGSLHNCFCIPSASILAPEQVITIGLDNYRVFPSRILRDNDDFAVVKEV